MPLDYARRIRPGYPSWPLEAGCGVARRANVGVAEMHQRLNAGGITPARRSVKTCAAN